MKVKFYSSNCKNTPDALEKQTCTLPPILEAGAGFIKPERPAQDKRYSHI